jgi:hypothetical protein
MVYGVWCMIVQLVATTTTSSSNNKEEEDQLNKNNLAKR